jgi:hypothetical protein
MAPLSKLNCTLMGRASGEIMKPDEMRELRAAGTSKAGRSTVTARKAASHRFRLLAAMAQGAAGALPEAWRSYRNVDEARLAARDMVRDGRVLRVAIVEDRPPLQLIEWVGR